MSTAYFRGAIYNCDIALREISHAYLRIRLLGLFATFRSASALEPQRGMPAMQEFEPAKAVVGIRSKYQERWRSAASAGAVALHDLRRSARAGFLQHQLKANPAVLSSRIRDCGARR
jgi:hypothetical protein